MKSVSIVAFLFAVTLAGCASFGHDFRWEDVDRIEVGMTREQVRGLLGDPTSVTVSGERSIWAWSYATGDAFGHSTAKTVSVTFIDGMVSEAPTSAVSTHHGG